MIKERFQRKIKMTVLQRQSIIIITMLVTLLAVTNWQRLYNDASEARWYVYLILIAIASIPLFRKNSKHP